jgi:DNA-binding transcriptional LysR family regulator
MARYDRRPMIDWNDLQFCLAVARHGTLSAAARALKVTQPTVGRRIAAFEKQLGAQIFLRAPSGWTLSSVGREVLAHAEHMQEHALRAENLAAGHDRGVDGNVRITASEWVIRSVLGPALAPFIARHPALCIELIAEARHLSLVKREADIALRPSKFTQQEIVQRAVATIEFGLYASDAYLASHGLPDFARGCEGHVLIGMTDDITNLADHAWLPPMAAKARFAVRTNGREPMATLAAAGAGITCLPRCLGDNTPSLRLLATPTPRPRRQLWLGIHRSARKTPRIQHTARFIRESLAALGTKLCP